jgi:hypothetical protein
MPKAKAKAKPKKKAKSRVNEAGNYTKPTLRKRIFERIKAGGKGGKPGQWSARKGLMALKKSQKSLKKWTKQKWRTKSGKPSTQGSKATGERYLPEKAIKAMSDKEYAATTRKKRADTKKGKQFSKQPKKVAKKTARHRK